MSYLLYNAALGLAAPAAAWWLRHSPKYHPLLQRFDPALPQLSTRPLCVQACSVGEVLTSRHLLTALEQRATGYPLLLSTSTVSGHDLAVERCPEFSPIWFPFDTRKAVSSFFQRASPKALILIETEIWPNVLREARQEGIPVIIVNGRLSDKHFARYWRVRPLIAPMFHSITAVGAQSAPYAERFIALGVDPDAVKVTGSIKFDTVQTEFSASDRARLRRESGLPEGAPVLLFGSTRPGDEALASACWATLRDEIPELRLVIAPRHGDRIHEIMHVFGEPIQRRSEILGGSPPAGARVLLLDTLGELASYYALATVAVIGGSFYPGVEGHNPLESAALGTPTVFGPYMNNFREAASQLKAVKGAVQVSCPEDLYAALSSILADPGEQRRLGTRGRKAVLDGQGATARSIDLIQSVLDQHDSRKDMTVP